VTLLVLFYEGNHAKSETHRKNALNNCPEETKIVEKESYKRKFYQPWFEKEQFKPYLEKIPNDPYNCFYSFCNSTFRCDLDALKRHSDTKKHISECQKRNFVADLNTSDDKPLLPFENRKKITEIKFVSLIIEKNISFKTAESILNFFQVLGKDPEILQSMTIGKRYWK